MVILCVVPFTEKQKEYLKSQAPEAEWIFTGGKDLKKEDLARAEVLIGNLPPSAIMGGVNLKWVQLNSAGVDVYCKEGAFPDGVIMTNARGAYSLSVSEWMMTATYMLIRRMDQYMRNQVQHIWQAEGNVTTLDGATVLLLGLGDIGSDYAKRVYAMGSKVIALTRTAHSDLPEYIAENHTIDELELYLPKADIVAMILPGTPATYHIMNADRLALMKKSAYLINAGRGNNVDNDALAEALKNQVIAGAALDVTDPEPLPQDHPLWDAPRAIVAPHVAGNFFLDETVERIARIAGENLKHYINGEKDSMINVIDRSRGY